ncbi:BglG family transcription antiterminator [Salinibacillus aidingensis]|uniref:BglG family transcription antiterminator n=1 Tax=Salinibacillus aidingensis TaxID=237684 RepID=A0ABN1AWK0_9BACI
MTLDKRSVHILNLFLDRDDFYTVQELSKKVGISRRTVYYDLKKINAWLSEHQLEKIQQQKGTGFYLKKSVKAEIPELINELDEWQYFHNKEERLALLAVKLMTDSQPLFVKDFMSLTRVSRGTVFSDLKMLKTELGEWSLILTYQHTDGYIIEGKESTKRSALVHYATNLISKDKWNDILLNINQISSIESKNLRYFNQHHLNQMKTVILNAETFLGNELTDETLHFLAIQLLILQQRIEQGNRVSVEESEKEVLKETKEFEAAYWISGQLKAEGVNLPEDEIYFLTMNLLGSRVNHSDYNEAKTEEMMELKKVIAKMVTDFQKYACVMLRQRNELEETLFTHLKPAYYRIKYDVEIHNNLTESVQEEYPEVYKLTAKVTSHLEALLNKSVGEQEIAYITIHFGGWLKKEGKRPKPRKRALIVCENGVGTSNILRVQLEELISSIDIVDNVSVRQFHQQSCSDVDVIFSTTPIQSSSIPVFVINPILNEKEKEYILRQFNLLSTNHDVEDANSISELINLVKKHATISDETALFHDLTKYFNLDSKEELKEFGKPMLKDLLTVDMIQMKDSVSNWEEAIEIAAEPLLHQNLITSDYVKAMISDVKNLGPYIVIAPRIAIPHSRPENGVNQVGLSMLQLKNSVSFSEQEKHKANLLFVLAAVDNETHLKALSQLTNMLSEDSNVDYLINASSKDEVIGLVDKYSN